MAVSPLVPPDPGTARDARSFVHLLVRLRSWAGQPSLRRLQHLGGTRRTARGDAVDALPPSTVSSALRRAELPRLEFVSAFTAACLRAGGVPADDVRPAVDRWRREWRRLATAPRDDGPGAADAAAARHQQMLPDVADFTGRTEQLETLQELLPAPGSTVTGICTVQGMPGVGKTRLVVHAAHRMLRTGAFADAALFVDLHGFSPDHPPARPETVLADLLRMLGVPADRVPAGVQARAALYRERLHGRDALLVLDDAADERQVAPLLPNSPSCLVLVTSRRRLAIDGAYPLPLDVFGADDAVDLLSRVAGPARVAADPGAARRVVEVCGRLPIAIALVARRLQARPAWTMTDLARRLADDDRRLGQLAAGSRAVRTAFDLSYRSLPAGRARMLRLLSVHPGNDVTAASAAALADTDPDAAEQLLEALLDEHLLLQDRPGRYHCHDLVRAYAGERCRAEDGDRDRHDARLRVLTWYLHTTDAANRTLYPLGRHLDTAVPRHPRTFTTHRHALAYFETEHDNLVDAVRIAVEHGLATIAWQLPAAMWGHFHLRKHWADQIAMYRSALAAAEGAGDRQGQASTLTTLAIAHTDLHRYDEAVECCERAVRLRHALGDRAGEAISRSVLGIAHTAQGRPGQALDEHLRAVAAYRRLGDLRGQALAQNSLADTHRRLGHHRQALWYLIDALAVQVAIDDRHSRRLTLATLGDVHAELGRHDQAVTYYRQALEICRELGDTWTAAGVLDRLSGALHAVGREVAARRTRREERSLRDEFDHGRALVGRSDRGASPSTEP